MTTLRFTASVCVCVCGKVRLLKYFSHAIPCRMRTNKFSCPLEYPIFPLKEEILVGGSEPREDEEAYKGPSVRSGNEQDCSLLMLRVSFPETNFVFRSEH